MKISIFNGSPRGPLGNSGQAIEKIKENMKNPHDVYCLRETEKHHEFIQAAMDSDLYVLIFPLYTDAMPAIVMAFIEALHVYQSKLANKKIYFIVHSGFPEAKQSYYVRDYLIELSKKLKLQVIDTIVMGGDQSKLPYFTHIGEEIDQLKVIDDKTKDILLNPISFDSFPLEEVNGFITHTNEFMNNVIKSNDCLEDSYRKPYLSDVL